MLQIISLVDITPSGKRSWTWSWTASGSLPTTATRSQDHLHLGVCLSRKSESFWTISPSEAQDSKASASTTHAAAEQDPALAASCWRGRRGMCRKGADSHFLQFSGPSKGVMRKILSARKAVRGLWQEEQDLLHRVVLPSGGYCRRRAVQHSPVRAFSPGAHRCDHHAPRMIFATTFIHALFVCSPNDDASQTQPRYDNEALYDICRRQLASCWMGRISCVPDFANSVALGGFDTR